MTISFSKNAWEDYQYWQKIDKRILKKINFLIREIQRTPFEEQVFGLEELILNTD
jgi:toxin YoeB